MESRNNLVRPLLVATRRNSTASPLRRRSSITAVTVSTELGLNDDEAERAALRLESAVPLSPGSLNPSGRRSLNFGAVTKMSTPQITDGIAECIRLNTQNKINMKNAFSLNMIDFMSYMVKNKNEQVTNLQMASQTLDVSAKIYALRVDVLHQDILKMIGNLDCKDIGSSNNINPGDDENADENATQDSKHKLQKKKKKSNSKIITTIEELLGGVEEESLTPTMFGETDCQTTDMLYQASLPQHGSEEVCLHPYSDVILDSVPFSNTNKNEPSTKWPPIYLNDNREICTMFADFEFSNFSAELEDCNSETPFSDNSSYSDEHLVFDLNASLPMDDGTNQNNMNYFDVNVDNEELYAGCHTEVIKQGNIINASNMVEKIPQNRLEYSYFSDLLDIRWAGPSHWKIKNTTKNAENPKVIDACHQDAVKKKTHGMLDYNDDIFEQCKEKFTIPRKSSIIKLKAKTAKHSWTEEKITLPLTINHGDKQKFMCQFDLRPDDRLSFIKPTNVDATIMSDVDEYNYVNENDTINYCPNQGNTDFQASDTGNSDGTFATDASQGGFTGNNLVEAPKLTQRIFIPFSQRAKKLDMRHLKKSIWKTLITTDAKEKENINDSNIEQNSIISVKEQKDFAKVFIKLPSKLPKSDAEEISVPIAFVSLLHLANEKCLKISSDEHFSGFTVTQDMS